MRKQHQKINVQVRNQIVQDFLQANAGSPFTVSAIRIGVRTRFVREAGIEDDRAVLGKNVLYALDQMGYVGDMTGRDRHDGALYTYKPFQVSAADKPAQAAQAAQPETPAQSAPVVIAGVDTPKLAASLKKHIATKYAGVAPAPEKLVKSFGIGLAKVPSEQRLSVVQALLNDTRVTA